MTAKMCTSKYIAEGLTLFHRELMYLKCLMVHSKYYMLIFASVTGVIEAKSHEPQIIAFASWTGRSLPFLALRKYYLNSHYFHLSHSCLVTFEQC